MKRCNVVEAALVPIDLLFDLILYVLASDRLSDEWRWEQDRLPDISPLTSTHTHTHTRRTHYVSHVEKQQSVHSV